MVKIAGVYKNDKNENLAVYLTSLGLSEDLAKKADAPGLTLEIIVDGNHYSLKSSSGINTSFTLNERFEEPLPTSGFVLKSIAKLEGNKIIIASELEDGRSGTRCYEFSESGITLVMTTNNVTATRYYSRV